MLAESVRDLIVNDAAAIAGLATWEFTSGAPEPAVFTNRRTPGEGKRPSVEVEESGGDHWGTRGSPGMDAVVQVRVMGENDMSQEALRSAAMVVMDTVHRANIDDYTRPRGYEGIFVLAEPPSAIIDEDGFPGYLIALRVRVLKL